MARNRSGEKRGLRQAELPLNYDVKPTFLDVDKKGGAIKFSKQGKGVMDMLQIRPEKASASGDVRMRFLRSRTHDSHSDLLHDAGYGIGEVPIQQIEWKGEEFYCHTKYTARSGLRGPLEIGVLLDSGDSDRDVRDLRGYEELRNTIALTSGYVIANHEFRRYAPRTLLELSIIDNFQTPGPVSSEKFAAEGIEKLGRALT